MAEQLTTLLRPSCERIEVAGSVRRKKEMVGDVELLVIPKAAVQSPLWLEREALDSRVMELMEQKILGYRLNEKGRKSYGRWNKMLVHVPSGIGVDLFSTTVENFGMALMVRTGSAAFVVQFMTRLKSLGKAGHAYGGISISDGTEMTCPTEEIVFRELLWRFRPPEERG